MSIQFPCQNCFWFRHLRISPSFSTLHPYGGIPFVGRTIPSSPHSRLFFTVGCHCRTSIGSISTFSVLRKSAGGSLLGFISVRTVIGPHLKQSASFHRLYCHKRPVQGCPQQRESGMFLETTDQRNTYSEVNQCRIARYTCSWNFIRQIDWKMLLRLSRQSS